MNKKERRFPAFHVMIVALVVIVSGSAIFLKYYNPPPKPPTPPVTLEQKMAYLDAGAPIPVQDERPEIPRWMMALILGFAVIQILPLILASHKARSKRLTEREVLQIEFLSETPLYLGLLGSLLGVALTHFLSGTMSAPLAYLTTISGILLFLFGRFFILLSLPSTSVFSAE